MKGKCFLNRLKLRGLFLAAVLHVVDSFNLSDFEWSSINLVSSLYLLQQPCCGRGGSLLNTQPIVAALDVEGKLVNSTVHYTAENNIMYMRIKNSPDETGHALLHQEGTTYGHAPYVYFAEGIADVNENPVFINEIGSGFSIEFISYGFGRAVESNFFEVLIGFPNSLSLLVPPGTAKGGRPFLPQPEVGVVDKGNNVITDFSQYNLNIEKMDLYVWAEIVRRPEGSNGTLFASGDIVKTNTSMFQGLSKFIGLTIDEAGYPYDLLFSTNFPFPLFNVSQNETNVLFRGMTVGVGDPSLVTIERDLNRCQGGSVCEQQPLISIRDAGFNLYTQRSQGPRQSSLKIFLVNNPLGGTLSSHQFPGLIVEFVEGYANFSDLMIDVMGDEYQLAYEATVESLTGLIEQQTIIMRNGEPFSVRQGIPDRLFIQQPITNVWAGGFPFVNQPVISLLDRGGNVVVNDSVNYVHAALVVNPTKYSLKGLAREQFFKGICSFTELSVDAPSTGYVLEFTTTLDENSNYSYPIRPVNLTFDVIPSAEFLTMSNSPIKKQKLGYSTALFGNLLIAGAPGTPHPRYEVQKVSILHSAASNKAEIQRIRTTAVPRKEIQVISSCGQAIDPSDTNMCSLQGYFLLEFRGEYTRPIRHDIHAEGLETYLESDISTIGEITVERRGNTDCHVEEAFVWVVHFNSLVGRVPALLSHTYGRSTYTSPSNETFGYLGSEFEPLALHSSCENVTVSVVEVQDSTTISGGFSLLVHGDETGHFPYNPVETTFISSQSTAKVLKEAIETAMNSVSLPDVFFEYTGKTDFKLLGVSRSNADSEGGYAWDVTFAHTKEVYDFGLFSVAFNNLTGYGARATTTTLVNGVAGISGYFQFHLLNAGPSVEIRFDADSSEVKAGLETLSSVTVVNVSDVEEVSSQLDDLYFVSSWSITFIGGRFPNDYGFSEGPPRNLPPLQVNTTLLYGTGAVALVDFAFGIDSFNSNLCVYDSNTVVRYLCTPSAVKRYIPMDKVPVTGDLGENAGSVLLHKRLCQENIWVQVGEVKSAEWSAQSMFGYSVSIDSTVDAGDVSSPVIAVGSPFARRSGDFEIQRLVCYATSGYFYLRFRSHLSGRIAFDASLKDLQAAIEDSFSIKRVEVWSSHIDGLSTGVCLNRTINDTLSIFIKFLFPKDGDMPALEPVLSYPGNQFRPTLIDQYSRKVVNGHYWGDVEISELVKGTIRSRKPGETGYKLGTVHVFESLTPEDVFDCVPSDVPLVPMTPAILSSVEGIAGDLFGHSVSTYLKTIIVGAPGNVKYSGDGAQKSFSGAVYVFSKDTEICERTCKGSTPCRATTKFGQWCQTQKLVTPDRETGEGFGYTVVIKANTVVASAPFKGPGRVYVFKRNSLEDKFSLAQTLLFDEYPGVSLAGYSINLHQHTLFVGAPASSLKGNEHGVVFVFERPSALNNFVFSHMIYPPTFKDFYYFGTSVSVVDNLLFISESFHYKPVSFAPRNRIQEIRSFIFPQSTETVVEQISGKWSLAYGKKVTGRIQGSSVKSRLHLLEANPVGVEVVSYSDNFTYTSTLLMPQNVSAEELKFRIENDLDVQQVAVARDGPNKNGGYSWTLSFTQDSNNALLFEVSGEFTTPNARIEIYDVQGPGTGLKNQVYGYLRDGPNKEFKLEVLARPEVQQSNDNFGTGLSIYGRFLSVGAFNRDLDAIKGINSGGVFIFNIDILNFEFLSPTFEAYEDDSIGTAKIRKCNSDFLRSCPVLWHPSTAPTAMHADPTKGSETQNAFFQTSNGTASSLASCPTKAAQGVGCLWTPSESFNFLNDQNNQESQIQLKEFSQYLSNGESDFAPYTKLVTLNNSVNTMDLSVYLVNDDVYEYPDEEVSLSLGLPGIVASNPGRLHAKLKIIDDFDYGIDLDTTYQKFFLQTSHNKTEFGFSSSIFEDIMCVGSPGDNVGTRIAAGRVFVYFKTVSGDWELETELISPSFIESGFFGRALQVKNIPPYRLIVGAPGESPPKVYIFVRRVYSDSSISWDLESNFTLTNELYDSRCTSSDQPYWLTCHNSYSHTKFDKNVGFGGVDAVSIDGSFAVVGAKGLEAAFIYRRGFRNNWYFFQVILSSDYKDEVYPINSVHRQVTVYRPLFGCSVSLSKDTLVVGAEQSLIQNIANTSKPIQESTLCNDFSTSLVPKTTRICTWEFLTDVKLYLWNCQETLGIIPRTPLQCITRNTNLVHISSSGLPTHPIGNFPLSKKSLFGDSADNKEKLNFSLTINFALPTRPTALDIYPQRDNSCPITREVIQSKIVGLGLNGVPFFVSRSFAEGDLVDPTIRQEPREMADLCNGVLTLVEGSALYGYRSEPICLYPAGYNPYQRYGIIFPLNKTGYYYPPPEFRVQIKNEDNPWPGQRSPKLGYALDGFPIYGPFDENGLLPTDLDVCNSRFDTKLHSRVYHITPGRSPYILGCWVGRVQQDTPILLNEYPKEDFPPSRSVFSIIPRVDPLLEIDGEEMLQGFVEHTRLIAPDVEGNDRFGKKVVVDGDELFISSLHDRATAETTWYISRSIMILGILKQVLSKDGVPRERHLATSLLSVIIRCYEMFMEQISLKCSGTMKEKATLQIIMLGGHSTKYR
eukprot:maker-scaffold_22-augustus-gene-5.19-mRNA-1 protein AED:0.07 eAED:0.16 QI:0/0/0/1/1/1/2/0/2604